MATAGTRPAVKKADLKRSFTIRMSATDRKMADKLARKFGLNTASLLRMGLHRLAAAEGV